VTGGDISTRALRRLTDMHAVYRMFDTAGTLLYVGLTAQPGRRIDQHCEKRWFPQVTTISVEWHPHLAAARLAEKEAIEWEWPRHNVVGVKRRSPRRPSPVPLPPAPTRRPVPQPRPAPLEEKPAPAALKPVHAMLADRATLTELIASGDIRRTLMAAQRRSTRDDDHPQPVGRRGNAHLYDIGQMRAYELLKTKVRTR
jgi:predicted GIY-YIG superfamily endonuclease